MMESIDKKTFEETTPKKLSYERDIKNLEEIKKVYDKCENLYGGFYSDMIAEINLQINHCKDCIKNLEK